MTRIWLKFTGIIPQVIGILHSDFQPNRRRKIFFIKKLCFLIFQSIFIVAFQNFKLRFISPFCNFYVLYTFWYKQKCIFQIGLKVYMTLKLQNKFAILISKLHLSVKSAPFMNGLRYQHDSNCPGTVLTLATKKCVEKHLQMSSSYGKFDFFKGKPKFFTKSLTRSLKNRFTENFIKTKWKEIKFRCKLTYIAFLYLKRFSSY